MNYILQIFQNTILQTAVISWFTAQMLKVILVIITERRVDFTFQTDSIEMGRWLALSGYYDG